MNARIIGNAFKLFALLLFLSARWGYAQWSEDAPILQASDEVDNAQFGIATDVYGDIAVIGAPHHPSGGTEHGQAYVYRKVGTNWVEEQVLQAPDQDEFALLRFGGCVAVHGNAILVGSTNSVYAFRFDGSTWLHEQTLQALDSTITLFGNSVSMDGNIAAIGAYNHPSGGDGRGRVYVFEYDGSAWVEQQMLQASDQQDFALFGYKVSVSGTMLIVSNSASAMPPEPFTTKAYIFRKIGSTWSERQILQPSDTPDLGYGFSVAISGSFALVSSPFHHSGGSQRGQAYLYQYDGSVWSEIQILQDPAETDNVFFGYSCDISPYTAVVARGGEAHVFRNNGGIWSLEQILAPSDGLMSSGYGIMSAIHYDRVVVGAWVHPSGGTARGRAYIYTGPQINQTRTWAAYE